MKKGIITVFIVIVLLTMLLAPLPAFSQPAKPAPTAAKPIKIGGSLPLTGIFSETAKWIKEGYDSWVDDINMRGGLLGRPVKMTIYDDESTPDKAVTYFERAITIDKVDLVFGGYPGTANVALMPLVEKYGMVFIGMGGHMKSFEQGYTYSFASPPLMAEWVPLAIDAILDDLIPQKEWPKSMAVVTMNNVIGQSSRGPVIKSAKIKVGMDEVYNLPLPDATPLVRKAKEAGAELLACMSFFDDAVMIMRVAKAIDYRPKLIFQILASTIPAWMKELGEDGNNVTSFMSWNPRLPYPGNNEINMAAKARLGLPAGPTYFGLGYCWMKTLELAVQGVGALDHQKMRDYLRFHKFDLPYGKGITFDKRGLPPPYCFVTQTTSGKVELLWPKEVATTKLVYPRPPWSK